jgi:hypothetical protein
METWMDGWVDDRWTDVWVDGRVAEQMIEKNGRMKITLNFIDNR